MPPPDETSGTCVEVPAGAEDEDGADDVVGKSVGALEFEGALVAVVALVFVTVEFVADVFVDARPVATGAAETEGPLETDGALVEPEEVEETEGAAVSAISREASGALEREEPAETVGAGEVAVMTTGTADTGAEETVGAGETGTTKVGSMTSVAGASEVEAVTVGAGEADATASTTATGAGESVSSLETASFRIAEGAAETVGTSEVTASSSTPSEEETSAFKARRTQSRAGNTNFMVVRVNKFIWR